MFSVGASPEDFESATITSHFGLCLRKLRPGKSNDYRDVISFQMVFRPHENEKPAFSNLSGLKSVFGKLRFRDGLVSWNCRRNRQRDKVAFSNFFGVMWTLPQLLVRILAHFSVISKFCKSQISVISLKTPHYSPVSYNADEFSGISATSFRPS